MKVLWTRRASADLKAIVRYISDDDPSAARRFADKLKRRAESLCRLPNRGRVMPELEREDVRELLEGNYRILYRVLPGMVHILTLSEGHKQIHDIEH